MLQQFYKETLQSQYIKYILNNCYIPNVPFTSNILHVTKGNTYIHDGYFVTAKKSDAIAAINEDIQNCITQVDKLKKYNEYFIKHEPYVFGRQYNGLTTKYKSNTKGYDSTTHYYLGEYLRAYKAHYNINLMPFYNCFSNEYADYLSLEKNNNKVILKNSSNKNYRIISVPIKFCQKYSIAIQCPSEVQLLPVFIGNKGVIEEKTSQLHSLDNWGKIVSSLDFKSPYVYESPHINSVSDLEQAKLQLYDKYLRLLIQIPANLKSSIVVLEGDYKNSKTYSSKIINTSKEDILDQWKVYYDTKIPYHTPGNANDNDYINIPSGSQLICRDIAKQKFYPNLDNDIVNLYTNEVEVKEESTPYKLKFSLNSNYTNTNNSNNENNPVNPRNKNNIFIKYEQFYDVICDENNVPQYYTVPLENLCISNGPESNYNPQTDKYKIIISEYYANIINGGNVEADKEDFITTSSTLELPHNDIVTNNGKLMLVAHTEDSKGRKVRELVISYDNKKITFYIQELAFYLKESYLIPNEYYNPKIIDTVFKTPDTNIILPTNFTLQKDQISINISNKFKFIQLCSTYPIENQESWDLKSPLGLQDKLSNYLNKNMISNLSLLRFNDGMSYGFCGRLIEYLSHAVIDNSDTISKNIKRVQQSLDPTNLNPNGLWNDTLRLDVYNNILSKTQNREQSLPHDINGFVDKDSEKLLVLRNELITH